MATTLNDNISDVKEKFRKYCFPDGMITVTIESTTTGELIDSCNHFNCKLVMPFADNADQDYYYFIITIQPKINLIVKSPRKCLKN